ncbi:hypothetical protein FDF64_08600 [Clostridium botulinum]|nr:hypothetical protein [Clostridium botulinum]
MLNYFKNNLISILAFLISLASFGISFKNYLKSNVKLKLSTIPNNNLCLGFVHYREYKLIIIDLTIDNNSTSSVNISRIKLVDGNNTYLANPININDRLNKNGISLISNNEDEYMPINISTENILNNTRISSYGTLNGYAVFNDVDLIFAPKSFKLIVDTPSKSFKTNVIVNLCPNGFKPLHPLKK